ncbi:MAG TPA: LacI family DNA-binding transcriptional regulator [Tepidisphaeraceae bacterium]|jgi:DNA-binding LacI/PurR family transcriptional regulator
MSMQMVAKLAGVSTSTVSRVVNDDPRVAAATAEIVRRAMKQISFTPTIRRNGAAARFAAAVAAGRGVRGATSIAFLVFGTSGQQTAPAFEQLLRGVSACASEQGLDMIFSFVSDPAGSGALPPKIIQHRVDGLLLHGERPAIAVQQQLQNLPTVWLMANRQRPAWGDQVMPDNTLIGEIAAQYLIRRGHRRLAYLGADVGWWAMDIRAMAFCAKARLTGAEVEILHVGGTAGGSAAPSDPQSDLWQNSNLGRLAESLVDRLMQLTPMPTGLFIAEDRLVPLVDQVLSRRGVRLGSGRDAEIVSCNNERPYLIGLSAQPATVDIRAESIGRRGIEQLIWRLRHPNVPERIRSMIEPILVEPATQ